MAEGVVEGSARLFPPPTNLARSRAAPGARAKGQPFYNPGMALNRDLSVLLVEAFARSRGREVDVADALAGTGARSVRLALEVQAPTLVHANDAQPQAVAALRAAAASNGVEGRLFVHAGDAHAFLASRRFDVVDLDPCGSPMPFLDAAVRATRPGGLVCATATDTGALAGTFPRACRRRYDAHHGLHAEPWRAEVGLRILAGAMVRAAARFERAATPVLSVSSGHWMRVVARVEEGKKAADAAWRRLGHATVDGDGLGRLVGHPPAGPQAGPLWTGPLHDKATLEGMQEAAQGRALARSETLPLLDLLRGEADAAPFWVVPDRLQKRLGPPPRRDDLVRRLQEAGVPAARTHLDPQGVRTPASLAQLATAWKGG